MHKTPFLDSEFVKQCMVDVAEAVFPENKTSFGNTCLSRRANVCHMEEINSDLQIQLNDEFRCVHISL
jgi:hypothetical protein